MKNDHATLHLSGRAVNNPSISGTNGDRVMFRAVSTERRYDEANAEWVDGDEFGANVVCWGKLGASVLQLLRKGDPVVIDGRMVTRKYDRNGSTEYYTECKADHVAIDIGRANGRVIRNHIQQESPAATEVDAQSAETQPAGVPPAGLTSVECADPFQVSADVEAALEPAF